MKRFMISISKLEFGSSMEVKELRKDSRLILESLKKRQLDPKILENFMNKDKEWREHIINLDNLRQQKNNLTLKIGKSERSEDDLNQSKKLGSLIQDLESKLRLLEGERDELLFNLPNIIDPVVPLDKLKVINSFGKPKVDVNKIKEFEEKNPEVEFIPFKNVKSQYDIIKNYDLVDEQKGAEHSGTRFYYKKNEFVLLNLAISLHAMKKLVEKGFKPIEPPYLVRRHVEAGATTLEAFEETLYKIEGEDLYLVPTAEHPIAAYNNNIVFNEKDLPLRYGGISPAFRKEAGAHGKDTRGIYRNHHFTNVEQYVLSTSNQAENELNLLIKNQVELMSELNIPSRVIIVPAFDMDKKTILHLDVEGWWPARNAYGELGSHGFMGSWQAVRFNIKYQPKDEKTSTYLHTIYGTMAATERTIACMLENCIDEEGVIHIPKILADYTGIEKIKPKKIISKS
jgi:seryl-tRNA synthetase